MLAALEQGNLESQGHCRPTHVIYQTIPAHPPRSAGLEFWDPHGPRYVLDSAGHVRRAGHFDEIPATEILDRLRSTHRQLSTGWKDRLNQSALYRTLLRTHRAVTEQDAALYGGIVGAAKQLVETRYPGAQFHVLLWDYEEGTQDTEWIQQTLAQHHVPVTTMSRVTEVLAPRMPADRPRYLMGVGTPEDLLESLARGVDMFDCVMPTRNARNGSLFTRRGIVRIKNARYATDDRPLDVGCGCPTCARHSRAYLRHLYVAGEILYSVLATTHNLAFYLDTSGG